MHGYFFGPLKTWFTLIGDFSTGLLRMDAEWWVYILRDSMDALYVGITTDVERRLKEHVEGGARSARYTRAREGLELVYSCRIGSRSLASRVEYRLKRCLKRDKEVVVEQALGTEDLLVKLGILGDGL